MNETNSKPSKRLHNSHDGVTGEKPSPGSVAENGACRNGAYRLVVQFRSAPSGRRKRGKPLDKPVVHVVQDDKVLCDLDPQAQFEIRDGIRLITRPGVMLTRITLEQVVTGMEACYSCRWWLERNEDEGHERTLFIQRFRSLNTEVVA